jgi:hypothetical protein
MTSVFEPGIPKGTASWVPSTVLFLYRIAKVLSLFSPLFYFHIGVKMMTKETAPSIHILGT